MTKEFKTMFKLHDDIPLTKSMAIYKEFMEANSSDRFLFGANTLSTSVTKAIECAGIIDDYIQQDEYSGLPILRSSEISKNAIVLNCIVYARPITARDFLDKKGVKNIDYFLFNKLRVAEQSDPQLLEADRLLGLKNDLQVNESKYRDLYDKLADDISKETLLKILDFRKTNDLNHMQGFINRQEEQYFDPVVSFKDSGEVFVDVGGFDGFTTQEFIKRCPTFKNVHIFEPDTDNIANVERNVGQLENVVIHQQGLSDEAKTLSFTSDGSSSHLSEDGDIKIKVGPLDDIDTGTITFIKMDIEGAEKTAIIGAQNKIRNDKPKLAICVYHLADDFWLIPELVLSIQPEYNIYLRHYTEGLTETVMYFIPK